MDGTQGDSIKINYRVPTGDYSDSACGLLSPGVVVLGSCP